MYTHWLHVETLDGDGLLRTVMLGPKRPLGRFCVWFPSEMPHAGPGPLVIEAPYDAEYRRKFAATHGQQLGPRHHGQVDGGVRVTRAAKGVFFRDGERSLYVLALPAGMVPTSVSVRTPGEAGRPYPCELDYNPDDDRWAVYVDCGRSEGTGTFDCWLLCDYTNRGGPMTDDESVARLKKQQADIPDQQRRDRTIPALNFLAPVGTVVASGDQIVHGVGQHVGGGGVSDATALAEIVRLARLATPELAQVPDGAQLAPRLAEATAVLDGEARKPQPGRAGVTEGLRSLRSIVEIAAGDIIANNLPHLSALKAFLMQYFSR